jgi:hypothetical protein
MMSCGPPDVSMTVTFGALLRHLTTRTEPADLVITLTPPAAAGPCSAGGTEGVPFHGELKTSAVIAAFTDQPEPVFPVVTPRLTAYPGVRRQRCQGRPRRRASRACGHNGNCRIHSSRSCPNLVSRPGQIAPADHSGIGVTGAVYQHELG